MATQRWRYVLNRALGSNRPTRLDATPVGSFQTNSIDGRPAELRHWRSRHCLRASLRRGVRTGPGRDSEGHLWHQERAGTALRVEPEADPGPTGTLPWRVHCAESGSLQFFCRTGLELAARL